MSQRAWPPHNHAFGLHVTFKSIDCFLYAVGAWHGNQTILGHRREVQGSIASLQPSATAATGQWSRFCHVWHMVWG